MFEGEIMKSKTNGLRLQILGVWQIALNAVAFTLAPFFLAPRREVAKKITKNQYATFFGVLAASRLYYFIAEKCNLLYTAGKATSVIAAFSPVAI